MKSVSQGGSFLISSVIGLLASLTKINGFDSEYLKWASFDPEKQRLSEIHPQNDAEIKNFSKTQNENLGSLEKLESP